MNIFQKFTHHSKAALKNAMSLAKKFGSNDLLAEHILLGISQEKGSLGSEILKQANCKDDIMYKLVEPQNPIIKEDPKELTVTKKKTFASVKKQNYFVLSLSAKKVLEKATFIASLHNHKYIGTEHLLSGILEARNEKLLDFLKKNNIDINILKERLRVVLKSTSKFPDLTEAFESAKHRDDDFYAGDLKQTKVKSSALDFYGTELTNERIQKFIDPLIGREEEVARLIQILCRRTKNNPLLLGDPGVGKTAIVEGLAKKILLGDVPDILLDKKIYTLDLGLLIAGSSFRGEFEGRLKNIIFEIKQNHNIILFIDEIHNIIGAGSATGSMDAANILKPSLARGEIRCIGATTMEEYKRYIENDLALERRFQPIMVHQPSVDKTIEILRGIKTNYEEYHQVEITDEAIIAACRLSHRYIQDKMLPDKAIDLIDEAAAAYKIYNKVDGVIQEVRNLENELKTIYKFKQKAVIDENFSLALEYRQKEEAIKTELEKLRLRQKSKKIRIGSIGHRDVIQVISKITKIPHEDLLSEEKNALLNLEKILSKKVIGQNNAISLISECIRRSKAGISDNKRPLGSFIFLGPSGVGKTELAKVLAETVFGGSDFLIRIDMSEFSESFSISKLIGSPAGYVGYKDPTKLSDLVRKKPYSVVLFDEIEKAHPQIFNLLLQILEDGMLTDATGKIISFKNTIVILTSNIGSDNFHRFHTIGFTDSAQKSQKEFSDQHWEEVKKEVQKKLKDVFKTEFLNRIDKIIIFNPLGPTSLQKIVDLQLGELRERLGEKNMQLTYDQKVIKWLSKKNFSPDQGARFVRKNILDYVENSIAEKILLKSLLKKERIVNLKIENNKMIVD